MKLSILVIITLAQFNVHGQLSQWTRRIITRNKIETVSVFQKVPKTNPEYYNEPQGFMAISETKFDFSGRVVEDICKNCAICFDCNRPDSDIDEKYYYEKGNLIRKEISRFERSTKLFYYDTLKNRILEIGLDKNRERNSVKVVYLNSEGKEISGYEIDFENASIRDDSVIQIFVTKFSAEYKKQSKTLKEFSYGFGTNIDRQRFEIFKNSSDIETICKIFEILDYRHLQLRRHTTTYYDDAGNELKKVDETDGTTINEYRRDKRGLILTEFTYWPKFTAKYVYRYKFRN